MTNAMSISHVTWRQRQIAIRRNCRKLLQSAANSSQQHCSSQQQLAAVSSSQQHFNTLVASENQRWPARQLSQIYFMRRPALDSDNYSALDGDNQRYPATTSARWRQLSHLHYHKRTLLTLKRFAYSQVVHPSYRVLITGLSLLTPLSAETYNDRF